MAYSDRDWGPRRGWTFGISACAPPSVHDTFIPVGRMRHRNWECPRLRADRATLPASVLRSVESGIGGDFVAERGLLKSVLRLPPPPAAQASFHWHQRPPCGCIDGTVYTDGSCLDGPSAYTRRCGWSFVVLDTLVIFPLLLMKYPHVDQHDRGC